MIVRGKQISMTVEELDSLLSGYTDNGKLDTIPEIIDEIGKIELAVRVFEGGRVKVKISDRGCGIEDIEKAMQPLFTTKPDEDRAGLGFAVMESFMDKIKVTSKLGKGTTVVLEKTVGARRRI